jgi:glycerophosphoryl diester phosphodiesterase
MARLRRGRLRWVIAGGVVIALVAAAVVAWPYVRRYTGSAPPPQFYDEVQLKPALARDYPRVLGVAHNAGNNLGTLSTALHYGADVIEIDVISARGHLVAGRNQPWGWLARQLFRGPTLAQAWDGAAAASIIKLDLKQTDRGFLDDLVAFLAPRARSRRVMISSRDSSALLYLHSRLPDVTMVFSVAGPNAVHQLKSDSALQKAIGGVSVFHGLVDANLVTWVHAHRLVILAWTVNDSETFNQMVRLGVDGITTDNLAILQALRRSTPTHPGDGATAPGTRRAAIGRHGQSDRLADLVRRTAAGRHVGTGRVPAARSPDPQQMATESASESRRISQTAAPDPDGQAPIHRAKIAPPGGGVQGGDFRVFLA